MNYKMRYDFSSYLNSLNWDYFVTVVYYRPISDYKLFERIDKFVTNSQSIALGFVSIEPHIATNSYHAHMVVQLKKGKWKKQQFNLEISKLEEIKNVKSKTVDSNVRVTAYTSKKINEDALYHVLLPKSTETIIKERISEFCRLSYNARQGDLRRAVVRLSEGYFIKNEEWDVSREEVNALISFLHDKCNLDALNHIRVFIIELLNNYPSLAWKPVTEQQPEFYVDDLDNSKKGMEYLISIIKFLDDNRFLCHNIEEKHKEMTV